MKDTYQIKKEIKHWAVADAFNVRERLESFARKFEYARAEMARARADCRIDAKQLNERIAAMTPEQRAEYALVCSQAGIGETNGTATAMLVGDEE